VKAFKSETLDINFIPLLVILNAKGEVVAKNGRGDIDEFGLQALQKWGSQKVDSVGAKKEKPSPKKEEPPKPPPAPEKKEMTMGEVNSRLVDLDGKVVETKINSVSSFEQVNGGKYRAYCYYSTGTSFSSGELVLIPEEGKEFFEELSKKPIFSGNSGETVYLWVHSKKPVKAKSGSYTYSYQMEALGTRYRKSTRKYGW